MKFSDLIDMAIRNLKARKLRTFLTILGVIIGTTSIIVMLSIGFGFQRINAQMYSSMGNLTILDLRKGYGYGMDPEMNTPTKEKSLNKLAVSEALTVEHVEDVMPIYEGYATLRSGRLTNGVSIIAIPPKTMENFDFEIEKGSLLNASDDKAVVFGGGVAKNFRDEKRYAIDTSNKVDALKSKIDLTEISYYGAEMRFVEEIQEPVSISERIKVKGALVDNPNNWETYNTIYLSEEYFLELMKKSQKNFKEPKEYNLIKVKVDDIQNVKQVQEKLKDMGYNASNMYAEILESENKSILVIQAVFGAISAVSFLVAAIGITNTMIMAIYERTKEIGVMKVIGASIKDIKKLFLTEAAFIGLFGGIVGVLFSLALSALFNFLAKGFISSRMGMEAIADPKISYIPLWLILAALFFSTAVGLLAGYFPARRAMKLSALDAIRNE
ncbi:hypothetical protein ING2D1G_1366 [Peptoniphilus sp. ING2-D1G]|nr:hypothetical protein ING2D1G_1366 [Peptoniphilus sp. ING2-D1G]